MSTLQTVALILGTLAAIATSLKILTGWGPVRFIFQHLVRDPVLTSVNTAIDQRIEPYMQTNEKAVQRVLLQVETNGGGSIKDIVLATQVKVDGIDQRLKAVEARAISVSPAD